MVSRFGREAKLCFLRRWLLLLLRWRFRMASGWLDLDLVFWKEEERCGNVKKLA